MKTLRLSIPLVVLFMLVASVRAVAHTSRECMVKGDPIIASPQLDTSETIGPVVLEPAAPANRTDLVPGETSKIFGRNDLKISGADVPSDDSPAGPDLTLTSSDTSLVSQWLEERAITDEALNRQSIAKRSTSMPTMSDLELSFGGGWCNHCGCWFAHGYDPNGTPQQQIGHPFVCIGGANTQNCWSHYYMYCVSTG